MSDPLLQSTLGGRFQLVRLLGEGGMGRVYEAHDLSADRRVAVKVMLEEVASDPVFRRRFEREANLVGSLSHPNIVRITAFGHDEPAGVTFLAMEYVTGTPLDQVISRGALDWRVALRIARALARGLADAHSRGIVHRDMKPDNVMLSVGSDGRIEPLILDFGIALPQRGEVTKLTQDGAICGTPHYMAPEQVRAVDVGPAADVYALGGTLFEMLTGRIPFEGNQFEVLLHKMRVEAPRLESALPASTTVPRAVGDLVAKTLQREQEDRHASMLELLDDVESILGTDDFTLRASPNGDPFSQWFARPEPASLSPSSPAQPSTPFVEPQPPRPAAPTVPEPPSAEPPPGDGKGSTILVVLGMILIGFLAFVGSYVMTDERISQRTNPDPIVEVDQQTPPPGVDEVSPAIDEPVGDPAVAAPADALCRDGKAKAGDNWVDLEWGSRDERFALYLPTQYSPDRLPRPMLLLHREHSDAATALRVSGFRAFAERHNLAIIAPRSPGKTWDFDKDLDFVRRVVELAHERACLDRRWLFAVGMGQGEGLAVRLPAVSKLSAIAGNGYRPSVGEELPPSPDVSPPYLHIWGKRNPFLPRNAQRIRCTGAEPIGLDDYVDLWRRRLGCEEDAEVYRETATGRCVHYRCARSPLALCFAEAATEWSGEEPIDRGPLCPAYKASTRFEHAEVIWDFFQREGVPIE